MTFKLAQAGDLWFHVKEIPGSHVIVKSLGKAVPDETILEAAGLAALFSKGKDSDKVAVDYCPRKNVRKIRGGKPGMVIYDNYNTLVVALDKDLSKRLKARN